MDKVRFEMRCQQEFLQAVDQWRMRQPSRPTRSEAIQLLVAVAIVASDAVSDPRGADRTMSRPH